MVRRGAALMLAASLSLSACARPDAKPAGAGAPAGPVAGVETITYETGPCKGACPVYRISVSSDGTGLFTGISHTQVTGERRFTVTPAQFLTFREQLLPWLPEEGERLYRLGTPPCTRAPTDLPFVDVTWSRPQRKISRIYYDYGCEPPAKMPVGEGLGTAVDALPVGDLIGELP